MSKNDKVGWLFLIISSLLFLGLKISQLSFRFGDGNEYVYMASLLGKGIIPYRDYFFVDPPMLIMTLSIVHVFFSAFPLLFQLVPVILEICNAYLLFMLLKKQLNPYYFLSPFCYLFSFTVLATSDYITGVQLVIFFSLLAIFMFEQKKYIVSGVFWACAVLTKMYAVPMLFGWLLYVFFIQKNKTILVRLLLGFSITCILIMLPFLLTGFSHVISYIILFHFNRGLGIDKASIYFYFIQHEWLFILLGICGLFLTKKRILLIPFLSITIFFLVFPDLYYLYLNVLMFFILFFSFETLGALWRKYKWKNELFGLIIVSLYLFLLFNWFDYSTHLIPKGRFSNANKIADQVKKLPDKYPIYGSHEVVPLLAFLSNRPILNNFIDTNPQGFTSFGQNKKEMSMQVLNAGAYVIGRMRKLKTGAYVVGRAGEDKELIMGFEGYIDMELFKKHCIPVQSFPSTSGEEDTHIGIFLCKR